MLNYEALPGKRYYIQYPSLEFCEAGRARCLKNMNAQMSGLGLSELVAEEIAHARLVKLDHGGHRFPQTQVEALQHIAARVLPHPFRERRKKHASYTDPQQIRGRYRPRLEAERSRCVTRRRYATPRNLRLRRGATGLLTLCCGETSSFNASAMMAVQNARLGRRVATLRAHPNTAAVE
jgi:hypothetical protein